MFGSAQKGKVLPIILFIIFVIVIIYFVIRPKLDYQTYKSLEVDSTNSSLITFNSKSMSFSLKLPSSFRVVEGSTFVSIKNDLGEIDIVKNNTNYDRLEDYLKTFDSRRNLSITNSEQLNMGNLKAEIRLSTDPNTNITQKAYFIYANYSVYIISTTSPELYDDLDMIAKSFKYIP